MTPRQKWRAYWAGALIGAEVIALRSGEPDAPLTAHLKWTFRTDRWWGRAASVAAACWLIGHLWGWWSWNPWNREPRS